MKNKCSYLPLKNRINAVSSTVLVSLTFLLTGCQTTAPLTPVQQSTVLSQFSSGNLRLTCSTSGCAGEFGGNRANFVQLHNTGRWRDLVLEISRVNYDEQMSYWYLGRAAEVNNNIQVARTYYNLAQTHSRKCYGVINTCDFPLQTLIPQRLAYLAQYERQQAARVEAEKQQRLQAEEAAKRQAEQQHRYQLAKQKWEAERLENERKARERAEEQARVDAASQAAFQSTRKAIAAELAQGKTREGVEYTHYSDGTCKENGPSQYSSPQVCLSISEYQALCPKAVSITEFATGFRWGMGSDEKSIIENGSFDGMRTEWNSRAQNCQISMSFSGMVRGNSRRYTYTGVATEFILKGTRLLVHSTTNTH